MTFSKFGKTLLMTTLSLGVILGVSSCVQTYTVGYLYVTGTNTASTGVNGILSGFKIDHKKGLLTAIGGLPIASGGANPVRAVIGTGVAQIVSYDTRGADDLLWGLGLGCEGLMQILLLRAGPDNGWQPLTHLAGALAARAATAIGVVVESARTELPPGSIALPADARSAPAVQAALERAVKDGKSTWVEDASAQVFVVPLTLPPRILLLGAGPDTLPVVDFAARLDWKVTLVDHRPAYAVPAHFPAAERVLLARPDELAAALDLNQFNAAVVMSHHLPSDLIYLRTLAASTIPYIGLLGPAARRERLLADLGAERAALRARPGR